MTTPVAPRYLGRTVGHPITADALDTVAVPDEVQHVAYRTSELAALCPVTQQPDVYDATITYTPRGRSLESKAFKHYLWSFRDQGIYCETLAATIARDLSAVLNAAVTVDLRQQVRGGLTLSATATATAMATATATASASASATATTDREA
ncbi:NADPH-dependent 7-cyano-7-deazaguanine reductase [Streptomyces sp. NPDC050658]|uniref:preQ(1) synthase n=1 Tax=unclassified Streptomyces TaxID=2593676 RepID=UPI00343073DE